MFVRFRTFPPPPTRSRLTAARLLAPLPAAVAVEAEAPLFPAVSSCSSPEHRCEGHATWPASLPEVIVAPPLSWRCPTLSRRRRQHGMVTAPPQAWHAVARPLPVFHETTRAFSSEAVKATQGATLVADIEPPSGSQLRMLFLASALPFIGFGFLDNFLMILFGDLIDSSLCVAFGFSTMAAAAIGNTLSDTVGIFAGGAVERLASRCGIDAPEMTKDQKDLLSTKMYQYNGQCGGIILGCVLGMCPLLWIDPQEGERLRKEKQQDEVYKTTVSKLTEILRAEAAVLMFADPATDELYARATTPNLPDAFRWKKEDGFMGHVARTGQCINIADAMEEPHYIREKHENFMGAEISLQSLLCMPIFSKGSVAALIMVANKEDSGVFTEKDEDVLSAICSHISTAMGDNTQTFEEILTNLQKSMARQGSPEWSFSAKQRKMNLYLPALKGISSMLDAESTTLMLLDSSGSELYTEAIDGPLPKHSTKLGVGVAGQAAELGQIVNVDESNAYWQNDTRHTNYQGTGMTVRSELVVPLFDTSKKCLGVVKCINKRSGNAFTSNDIEYMTEVGQHLSIMLEGPEAGLKRVLALTRMRMQAKDDVSEGVVCFLESSQHLIVADENDHRLINAYVTVTIVRGDPLKDQPSEMPRQALQERKKDHAQHVRRFAKSQTQHQNADPQWNDSMQVALPEELKDVPLEELYVHVLIWDYSAIGTDDLAAQVAFPMRKLRKSGKGDGTSEAFPLLPVPGSQRQYKLDKAKIWLNLGRVSGQVYRTQSREETRVKRSVTYRPRMPEQPTAPPQ